MVFLITTVVIIFILGISYFIGKSFINKHTIDKNQEMVNVDVNDDSTIAVEIPQGASTKTIAEILKDNDLIDSKISFRITSKINGTDGTYNYGKFYFTKDMTIEQIIKILQSTSNQDTLKITIPEGYTVKQIASLIDEMGIDTKENFLNEVNNGLFEYEFLEGIPKRDNYLEGYLFPDTYFLSGNETSHDIIVMMLNRFEQIYNESIKNYVEDSNYTLDQLVTVASIVESEAKADEERAIIAGVIYNRINIDMPLQIDSTVQYALSSKNEVVTYSDLEVDSPYNTYKNIGLPPGPICSPGKASLLGAVQPESHNYYYYVLKEQGGSYHTFTETYDDFLTAKAEYKATFNN